MGKRRAHFTAGLSDHEWAVLELEAAAIRTEVMERGERAYIYAHEIRIAGKGGKHGPSIKCPDIYEALRRPPNVHSKKKAAKISNECWKSPQCKCH